MKKIYKSVLIITLFSFVLISCEDIFEANLDDEIVTVVAPTDGAILNKGNVVFYWDYLDYNENFKESYNLMVVSPSFDAITEVVLDTSITSNMFQQELNKGEYELRVYAFNGSTSSESTFHSFTVIDTTSSKNTMHNIKANLVW